MITAIAVSHGACRHRLHFAISQKIHNFARSFRRLSCIAASRILHVALYQHPPPDGPARRTSSLHLQPLKASNLDGPCTNPCGKEVSVFCFCVILCGILCCPMLFVILIVIKFILFANNKNNNNYGAINFGNEIQRYYATLNTFIIIYFFSLYTK